MDNKKLVIIPTYNEIENVTKIITQIFALPTLFHVLIIDDASPDGTAKAVKKLQENFPEQLFLMERPGKLGLGTAYIHGFKWALEKEYDLVFEMDADFSHNPADLLRLHQEATNGADLVIGSRYKSGVNVVNWPISRVLLSYFASVYVRKILGMPIMDTTAGFKCYKKKVLKTLNLNQIRFKGYAFQIEMKFLTWQYGFKIVEIPIIFINRQLGISKMSGGIFKEAFFGVLQMKVQSWFTKYKK